MPTIAVAMVDQALLTKVTTSIRSPTISRPFYLGARFARYDAGRKTRRAYKNDVEEFVNFGRTPQPSEMRTVTRSHVIAWRKDREKRRVTASSIRRKLSALSALFDYLGERNAVASNPVDGVKRAAVNGKEGSTRRWMTHKPANCSKRRLRTRSRACATALSWPPCSITVCAATSFAAAGSRIQDRQGVKHFRVKGKRNRSVSSRFMLRSASHRGIFGDNRPR